MEVVSFLQLCEFFTILAQRGALEFHWVPLQAMEKATGPCRVDTESQNHR